MKYLLQEVFEWAIKIAVIAIAIAAVVFLHIGLHEVAEGSEFQPTPYTRIARETDELYRIGGEHEVRAYANNDGCLSAHRVGNDVVLYWWCDRFKMIDEAHRITQ